jgi:hypothetical protein
LSGDDLDSESAGGLADDGERCDGDEVFHYSYTIPHPSKKR